MTVLAAAMMMVPVVHAEGHDEGYPHCRVFQYTLDPPGYNLHPDCLFPLPPPVQEIVDEIIDP